LTASLGRVLVTGGAGFVGSNLVDRLIFEGNEVVVFDDFSSGNITNLERHRGSKFLEIVMGDVNDKGSVKATLRDVQVVFHEAAIVSVQQSVSEPEFVRHVNVDGTRRMLDCAAKSGVQRFILASSAAVYGNSEILPLNEKTIPSPVSPYAEGKLACEKLAKDFYVSLGLKTCSLRYFNIYGPRSTTEDYSGVINIFAKKLVENQSPIIYGNGLQSRDFVNINDIVTANVLAAKDDISAGKIYNVGTSIETTVDQLAKMECKILLGDENARLPEYQPARKGDVFRSCADISLIRNELKYTPYVSFESGLKEYLINLYPKIRN
jgi:UDP-glucose 4-epimerase